MLDISSPIRGFRTLIKAIRSKYAAALLEPPLVFDFVENRFRILGSPSTAGRAINHNRSGNATMVDRDGLIKWAPHNLALNSESPATQSITVVSGAEYTVACTGVSIVLSGAGTGTVTEGNPVEITASTTTLTLTVTGSTGALWAYRSDLGGMVNNPETGDSYVPTTDSARYLPRIGNHVYNGSAWVNEGLLHESEARTNLFIYSQDFTDTTWGETNVTVSGGKTGPDGEASAYAVTVAAGSGQVSASVFEQSGVVALSAVHTAAVYAKKNSAFDWFSIRVRNFTTPADGLVYFNLSTGAVGTEDVGLSGTIEAVGNGWYRCAISFTTDAVDDSGEIRFQLATDDNTPAVQLGSDNSVLLYGAQLEEGSTPSSYIPTNGSTATRAADTITIPSASLPVSGEMPEAVSIQMDGTVTSAAGAASTFFLNWREDSNNRIFIVGDDNAPESENYRFLQAEGGVFDEPLAGSGFTPGINVPFNIASRHGSTFVNGAVDGVALTANTTPTALPDLSATDLELAPDYMGGIGKFRVWPQDIGDDGIEEATS